MPNILITGGDMGLGKAMRDALWRDGHKVFEFNLSDGHDVRKATATEVEEVCEGKLDILVNNAGINLIGWLDEFGEDQWDDVLNTNAKGIFMMTRAALSMLKESRGTVVNIVSNAATMPMTCSAAYNASKGAALILTRQMARELTKKDGITVFSVSPNKLAGTNMSNRIDEAVVRTRGWTADHARQYQLNALLPGEETPPETVAEFISFLLSSKDRHRFLSGCDIPYGA